MQEVSGNMAKAIDLKSVKTGLQVEISYIEEIQEEDIFYTRASPHEVEAGRG